MAQGFRSLVVHAEVWALRWFVAVATMVCLSWTPESRPRMGRLCGWLYDEQHFSNGGASS